MNLFSSIKSFSVFIFRFSASLRSPFFFFFVWFIATSLALALHQQFSCSEDVHLSNNQKNLKSDLSNFSILRCRRLSPRLFFRLCWVFVLKACSAKKYKKFSKILSSNRINNFRHERKWAARQRGERGVKLNTTTMKTEEKTKLSPATYRYKFMLMDSRMTHREFLRRPAAGLRERSRVGGREREQLFVFATQ